MHATITENHSSYTLILYHLLISFFAKSTKSSAFGSKIAAFPTVQQIGHSYSEISSAITTFQPETGLASY